MAQSHHHHHNHGEHPQDHQMASVLDLDAAVAGGYIDDAIDLIRDALPREPKIVVDIGSGTGTGTDRLAARFDAAEIIAVDHSPELAELLTERAAAAGYADRLRTVLANLDDGWPAEVSNPEVSNPDVVWASSSLHHIADPDRFLAAARTALTDDGILAVIELAGAPKFLPDDPGVGLSGLEGRCQSAMSANGWNSFPDWTTHLQSAGFDVVAHRRIRVEPDPLPPQTVEYAVQWYSRLRVGLAEVLDADDLAALDVLLSDDSPLAFHRRGDLTFRAGRIVWIARPATERNLS
ncbi:MULTISPECIES: trans-aconitate 2-methyltransferase [unclassified Gordonia (in: high G+C Gram-positive bacteria)]|uniref:class I SAM-dependent methyltransferase n=1 Tax=unclassified Gordonia (in: high G+C Gram-positive bacteria) TaxID=2657482 RepID=UPI001F0E2CBC|nr:class I SAM-dependent methyltransferase [Gordonia sp. ABSL49_1]MCH5645231.1 class I SAM-dependent methyltransferase [Gordonia sp. ABSL49_1]